MTCHGRFCDRDKLEQGKKKESLEGHDHGAFQKLVASHTSTVLAENRNSCAFSEVLLGLGLCQSVTCRGALFSENSKSYVILEVFLWAFELLRSCCLRRRCVS